MTFRSGDQILRLGLLVDTDMITAHSTGWTGFQPQLWGYCKCYYTSPKPS